MECPFCLHGHFDSRGCEFICSQTLVPYAADSCLLLWETLSWRMVGIWTSLSMLLVSLTHLWYLPGWPIHQQLYFGFIIPFLHGGPRAL